MIYWTNLLIRCPVSVSCLLHVFVLQKIHIKRSPNVIKIYGELFWNICGFWDLESTQTEAHSAQETSGHTPGSRRVVVGCAHLVHRLGHYLGCKKAYIRKKIMLEFQRNRSYGSPGI